MQTLGFYLEFISRVCAERDAEGRSWTIVILNVVQDVETLRRRSGGENKLTQHVALSRRLSAARPSTSP